MVITVNKKTATRGPVQYAALASGTISHVWSDEEVSGSEKRRVKVMMRSEKQSKKTAKRDS